MTTPYEHPDYLAQLAGVRAEPGDDVRRLVLADWLDEHGEAERAEFIRVQVAAAAWRPLATVLADAAGGDVISPAAVTGGLAGAPAGVAPGAEVDWRAAWVRGQPPGVWDGVGVVTGLAEGPRGLRVAISPVAGGRPVTPPERQRVEARGRELYPLARQRWLGGARALIPAGASVDWVATFRRGFVAAVRCPLGEWLAHGPAAVRSHPVERVEATDRVPFPSEDGVRSWWAAVDPPTAAIYPQALPAGVFRRLPGDGDGDPGARYRSYPSDEAARAALSQALLAWATAPEPVPA